MPSAEFRARARQWSRMAWALGALFGSLPLAAWLFTGAWGFDGAGAIASLFLVAGTYFYIVSVRVPTLQDPAAMLDQANQLTASGRPDRAIRVLTKTIRQSPRFWQAYQYRGQMYLQQGDVRLAIEDFEAALRLAPGEPVLQQLRDHALRLMDGAELPS